MIYTLQLGEAWLEKANMPQLAKLMKLEGILAKRQLGLPAPVAEQTEKTVEGEVVEQSGDDAVLPAGGSTETITNNKL